MKLGPPTRIFVLHCWQVSRAEKVDWRFRLEIPATQQALTFSSLYDVFAYLLQHLHGLEAFSSPLSPEQGGKPEE